jgi:PRTRC genetic system protein E
MEMFQELMPLLRQRSLVLTLSWVSADEICVNVIPQRLKSAEKDDNDALTTPLSLTGTAIELDQDLPKHLVEFVGAHIELSSTLKSAKQQMDAAAKSAKEASRKPQAGKSSTGSAKEDTAKDSPGATNAAAESDSDSSVAGAGSEAAQNRESSSNCGASGNLFSNASVES